MQVYTGNGKGKTTAALGQAIRALGHGQRVFMLQFMKGSKNYGELKIASRLAPDFIIEQSGRDEFVDKLNPAPVDIELARQGLARAKEILASGEFDMVILDEINVAVDFGLLPVEEVTAMLKSRPRHIDVVLTGRYAHPDILALADLVSDVQEVRHHYHRGVEAREGIEF